MSSIKTDTNSMKIPRKVDSLRPLFEKEKTYLDVSREYHEEAKRILTPGIRVCVERSTYKVNCEVVRVHETEKKVLVRSENTGKEFWISILKIQERLL